MTTARSARYQRLSAFLASCSDTELAALMDTDRASSAGVGGGSAVAAEHADIDAVVAALGGSPAVRVRLEALVAASCSLVLFGEYIPHPVSDWLREDPVGKAARVERQFAQIVTFLRGRELLHMDGHLGNMRTGGERIYLNDFGLATSPRFDLSAAERDFAERHATHDAGYAATRLVNWLVTDVCGVPVPNGDPWRPGRPQRVRTPVRRRFRSG